MSIAAWPPDASLEEDTEICQRLLPRDSDKAWTESTRQNRKMEDKAMEKAGILLRCFSARNGGEGVVYPSSYLMRLQSQ
jgi:hypothetical protein